MDNYINRITCKFLGYFDHALLWVLHVGMNDEVEKMRAVWSLLLTLPYKFLLNCGGI